MSTKRNDPYTLHTPEEVGVPMDTAMTRDAGRRERRAANSAAIAAGRRETVKPLAVGDAVYVTAEAAPVCYGPDEQEYKNTSGHVVEVLAGGRVAVRHTVYHIVRDYSASEVRLHACAGIICF
jgi:hypothetical protein